MTFFRSHWYSSCIGKGILLAEVQESSNVIYRVYDYDRVDKNGNKRDWHFDKAVQVMNMGIATDIKQKLDSLSTTLIVQENFFADVSILRPSESRSQKNSRSRSERNLFKC